MSKKLTQDEAIEKFREKQGFKYDYSKVVYVNMTTKVEIGCLKHGSFWKRPGTHLNQLQGCPKCSSEKIRTALALSNTEFVTRAVAIHGNLYNYSKVVYVNSFTKVKIICRTHGLFWQKPGVHIYMKRKCPKCV